MTATWSIVMRAIITWIILVWRQWLPIRLCFQLMNIGTA